jgi:hypothetical protein
VTTYLKRKIAKSGGFAIFKRATLMRNDVFSYCAVEEKSLKQSKWREPDPAKC